MVLSPEEQMAALMYGGTGYNPEAEQRQEQAAQSTTTTQTTQPTGDTWKPDFTQPNPWNQMPPDYGGIATFTPTESNPTPPWEQPATSSGITTSDGSPATSEAVTVTPPNVPKYGTEEYKERAREIAEKQLAPFKSGDSIDLSKVAEAGKASYLRPLGVSETVIKQAQEYASAKGKQTRAEKELKDYALGDGYDVVSAVKAGKTKALKDIGYTDQDIKSVQGYLKNKDAYEKEKTEFEKNNVFIPADAKNPEGTWITKASFDKLPKDAQNAIKSNGLSALDTYEAKDTASAVKLLPADALAVYNESGPEDKFAILKAYGVVPTDAAYVKSDAQGNPMFRRGGDLTEAVVSSTEFPMLAGDILIPGFATVRHWNDSSPGEKAFSIAMDALTFIPIVGAAGKGARATSAVTRVGRLAGAAKGVGREALAQAIAPVDMVLHPVQTVKGTASAARDLVENVGSLSKLKEAVITTTNSTVRIPVKNLKTEKQAIEVRETLAGLARKGDMPVVEANGQRFELSRSALMKEVGGGLTHTTPSGEAFVKGLTVAEKPGLPASEQGLFLSHEPLPRFTASSAFGATGEKPAILIIPPEMAKDAIPTGKIYSSKAGRVAEIEMKFPVGYKLPPPVQKIYTRLGPERTRVDIFLYKPLTPAQKLKLKSLAAFEDVKATVTPSLLITKNPKGTKIIEQGLSEADVTRVARELRRSGNAVAADSLIRAYRTTEAASRARGDIVAVGSIRERGVDRPSRDSLVIRATGTPREPVERAAERGVPIAFRAGGASLPGRVEIPRTVSPDRIQPPSSRRDTPRDDTPTGRGDVPPYRDEPPPRGGDETPRGGESRPPDDGGRTGIPDLPRNNWKPDVPVRAELPKMGDTEKRDRILKANGAIGWRQGEVSSKGGGRQDVWYVITAPFTSKSDRVIVVGRRPAGVTVVRGPDSARRTAQVLYGKNIPYEVTHDVGFYDAKLEPESGNKIKLSFDYAPGITGSAKDAQVSEPPARVTKGRSVFPLERRK